MSIQFNDTNTYRGLVQQYEDEIGANQGDVSGNTTLLKQFTAEVNQALDEFTSIAINTSGTWQWDDTNHTGYPIIKANLVSGQKDYPFTSDGSSNLILDIYKVLILPSATATKFDEIHLRDQQSDIYSDLAEETNTSGVPREYDKTANSIFLDPTPNYNATLGLKMFINREASYFVSTDTTKKAGIPGIFHHYLYLKPALVYARRKGLQSYSRIEAAVIDLEGSERLKITGKIQDYYNRRNKDEQFIMSGEPIEYE